MKPSGFISFLNLVSGPSRIVLSITESICEWTLSGPMYQTHSIQFARRISFSSFPRLTVTLLLNSNFSKATITVPGTELCCGIPAGPAPSDGIDGESAKSIRATCPLGTRILDPNEVSKYRVSFTSFFNFP